MSDKDFLAQRHLKIWDEQNKLMQRLIIGVVIFSALLLIKVFGPFIKILEETSQGALRLEGFKKEQRQISIDIQAISQFETTLRGVQEAIKSQPWMKEKDKLIRRLAEIRSQSPRGGNWGEYQQAADSTIREIHRIVQEKVIGPLEMPIVKNPEMKSRLPELAAQVGGMQGFVQGWEKRHVGAKWYETLSEKHREMGELTSDLESKLKDLAKIIQAGQTKLDAKRVELEREVNEKGKAVRETESILSTLEDEMQKILPGWIRGILNVEQMLQLFPFVILGLLAYVMLTARSLALHHDCCMDGLGISGEVRKDPSVSSLWTMTDRGMKGTLATFLVYISFAVCIWVFFEWENALFRTWWKTNSQKAIIPTLPLDILVSWLGRASFSATLVFLLHRLLTIRRRRRVSGASTGQPRGGKPAHLTSIEPVIEREVTKNE